MIMRQSLYSNFALNNNRPKVITVEQDAPPPTQPEPARQSPCPSSNWSDYLLQVDDESDNENPKQTDPLLLKMTLTNRLHPQVHAYLKIHQPIQIL